jgi:type IV secretion system protein VirB9
VCSLAAISGRRVGRPERSAVIASIAALLISPGTWCDDSPIGASIDQRIRVFAYDADEVYRLKGYVGYQIDVEFESGETFVGLGTGDLESLTFASQDNHLFLKPKANSADTNVTVLTTRRVYHFDYSVSDRRPNPTFGDVTYVLRFTYPRRTSGQTAELIENRLNHSAQTRWHNLSYAYRGSVELKPESAWDDGVQTRLRFGAQQELPAIFVRNDDDSESLVNFTVEGGEVIVHRVGRHFVVRRGRLEGCIVNSGFTGGGERLESGTVAPAVERMTKDRRQ